MSIRLNAGDDVKEYLVEKGYDEKYGARPLKRTIQNLIEDKLAELVLEGKVREGDSVKITCKDGELKFSARHPQTAGKNFRQCGKIIGTTVTVRRDGCL